MIKTKVVAIANHKGGTGKTTSCINIGGWFAKKGNRVLVDFNPQANATFFLGINNKSLKHSVYDAVLQKCGYKGVPLSSAKVSTKVENLHIAPSEINLSVCEMMMHRAKNRTCILDGSLDEVRPPYDYILIELPPSSGLLTINGLRSANTMVVPVEPGAVAVDSVESLRAILLEIEQNTGHFVSQIMVALCRYVKPGLISQMLRRKNPSQEIEAGMREMFPALHIIPESDKIYEAQKNRLPISHYAPESDVGGHMKLLQRALLAVIKRRLIYMETKVWKV